MEKIGILDSIPYLLTAPSKHIWIDYDDEADVMYISFYKPQKADDSVMEDDVIYHYRDKKLVGITVLRASRTCRSDEENASGNS